MLIRNMGPQHESCLKPLQDNLPLHDRSKWPWRRFLISYIVPPAIRNMSSYGGCGRLCNFSKASHMHSNASASLCKRVGFRVRVVFRVQPRASNYAPKWLIIQAKQTIITVSSIAIAIWKFPRIRSFNMDLK